MDTAGETIRHKKRVPSKVKWTYLFVIGALIFSIAIQLSSAFLFHIPRTGTYKALADFWEIALLGLPILVFFLATKEKPRAVFQFHAVSFKNIAYIVLLAILFIPISGAIGQVSRLVFPNPVLQNAMRNAVSAYPLWLALIIVALQPALLEELFFRGIVRDGFDSYPLKRQALLVGICFGLFHLNFAQIFYAAVLGVLMVYIFYYTRSIIASMVFHFATNGIDVTISHLLVSRASTTVTAAAKTVTANPYSAGSLIGAVISLGILLAIFIPLVRVTYQSFVRYNKIRLGMTDSVPPLLPAPTVPVYAQYVPAEMQPAARAATPATSPPPTQPPVSEQRNIAAASSEGLGPLAAPATPPTKEPRLFTPLLITAIIIAVSFATFVQIYDTLIIR